MNKKTLIMVSLVFFVILIIIALTFTGHVDKQDKREIIQKNTKDRENEKPFLNFENTKTNSIENYLNEVDRTSYINKEKEAENKIEENEKNNKTETGSKSSEESFIKIKNPKKEEVFYKESKVSIKWESSNDIKNVDIKLIEFPFFCDGNKSCESLFNSSKIPNFIANDIKNNGEFLWKIENDIDAGKYKIKIIDSNRIRNDSLGDVFAISGQNDFINIEFPTKNYSLSRKESNNIIWSGGSSVFYIKILLRNNNNDYIIASKELNDGIFTWEEIVDEENKKIDSGRYNLKIEAINKDVSSKYIPIIIE